MDRKKSRRKIGDPADGIVLEPRTTHTTSSSTYDAGSSNDTAAMTYHNSNSDQSHPDDRVNGERKEPVSRKSHVVNDHNGVDDNKRRRQSDGIDNPDHNVRDGRRGRRFTFFTILASAGALLAHRSRVNHIRKTSYDKGYKEGYRKGAEDSLSSIGIRGASYQSDNNQSVDINTQLISIMNGIIDAYSAKPELILKVIGITNHFFFQSHTIGTLTALLDSRRSHLNTIYDDVTCLANDLYKGPFPENSIIGKALQARNLPLSYGTSACWDKEEDRGYLPAYSAILKASCLSISYSVNNKCLLNKTSSYSVAKLMQVDLLERILGNIDINRLEGIWRWNLVDNSIYRPNFIYEALPFFSFNGEKSKPLFSGFSYFGDCVIPMFKTSPSTVEHDEFYLSACADIKRTISPVLEKYSFYQSDNALNKLYSYNTLLNEPSFLGSSTLALDRLLSEKEEAINSSNHLRDGDAKVEFNKYFWDKVSFYQLIRSYTITVSVEEKEDDRIIHIVCMPNTRVIGNHTGIATFNENLYSGMSSIFQVAKDPDTGRNYIMGPMRSYCSSEYISSGSYDSKDVRIVDIADRRSRTEKQSHAALFLSMAGQNTKSTGFFVNTHSEVVDIDGRKDVINNLLFDFGYAPKFFKKWGISYACVHWTENDGYQDSRYQILATDSTSVSLKWHIVPFIS